MKKTYKCGHLVKAIIINTSEELLSKYFEWKNSDSGLCLDCWLKKAKV